MRTFLVYWGVSFFVLTGAFWVAASLTSHPTGLGILVLASVVGCVVSGLARANVLWYRRLGPGSFDSRFYLSMLFFLSALAILAIVLGSLSISIQNSYLLQGTILAGSLAFFVLLRRMILRSSNEEIEETGETGSPKSRFWVSEREFFYLTALVILGNSLLVYLAVEEGQVLTFGGLLSSAALIAEIGLLYVVRRRRAGSRGSRSFGS